MDRDRYTDAVQQLAAVLNLSEDAISVAEGWSILPEAIQRHFKRLMDEYIAGLHPMLAELYANAKHADQLRFNRIAERAQSGRHLPPSAAD